MGLFNKIKRWFTKKPDIITISLATCYNSYTNSNQGVFSIEDWMMRDIKDQATKKILSDPKLLQRCNRDKHLMVKFSRSIPIGINVDVSHPFYWNGEALFSLFEDSTPMKRDILIDQILK